MKSLRLVVLGMLFSLANAQAFVSTMALDSVELSTNQHSSTVDWQKILEEMAENGMEGLEWEERLTELANNPISLNEASKEELESIPFINDNLIENLSYYLYRYGPMVNLSELMLVEGMDVQTLRWLKPFVRIDKGKASPIVAPTMQKALKYGKQSLRLTVGRMVQKKNGFEPNVDDSAQFAGDPFHTCLRYEFNYKGLLQWGFVLEKDPGEKWWNSAQNGIDYPSFHFVAKDSKRRNRCILGDYTVRFGQGLVCGSSFSLGKNTSGLAPEQTGNSINRHFSSSETGFFRGAALQLTLNPFLMEKVNHTGIELTAFISKRLMDANVEQGLYSTIYETGLHRNRRELETQNRLGQTVVGGHAGFRKLNLAFGMTFVSWLHDSKGKLPEQLWNIFKTNRDRGGNVSADFRMVIHRFSVFGEMAFDNKGQNALLVGTTFKPYPRMSLSMLARKFAPEYLALFGHSFSEGSSTSNEEGLYASTDVLLAKRVQLTGYVDVYRFPWLNFGVKTPSWGQDFAMELSSTIGRHGLIKWMYKSKLNEKALPESKYPTSPTITGTRSQMRVQVMQKLGSFSLKSQLHFSAFHELNKNSNGFALSQDLGFESETKDLTLVLHAVLFNADSWENRIYLWEKDLPGTFSMPMLYGKGNRLSLCAKYNYQKKWELQIKLSNHVLPNQIDMGVGQERIFGNRRTEVGCQLNWKF